MITEIRLGNEKCFRTCLFQSPSQDQCEFENFRTNLDSLMDHINNALPTFSVLIGHFNARCSRSCNNDFTNANGCAPDTLTPSVGY